MKAAVWVRKICKALVETDVGQIAMDMAQSVWGPAQTDIVEEEECDLFETKETFGKVPLRSIEQLHQLQFKIHAANDILTKIQGNPNISPAIIQQKYGPLIKAKGKWEADFKNIVPSVIPSIEGRLEQWVTWHSPKSSYRLYYDRIDYCMKAKGLTYFPLKSIPASFYKLTRQSALLIISQKIKLEDHLEEIGHIYSSIKEMALAFMLKKGYRSVDPNQALVALAASNPKVRKEFADMIRKSPKTMGQIANEIVSNLPRPWYILFPEAGKKASEMIRPYISEEINKRLKERFPDVEKTVGIAAKALEMLKSAQSPDQLMAAISFILNIQHNTGSMAEHFGLTTVDLDKLTARMKQFEPVWTREVQQYIPKNVTYRDMLGRGGPEDPYENFSVYNSRTLNWFKIAQEESQDFECPDFYSQLQKGSKGMLLDNGNWITWSIDRTGRPEHDTIAENCFYGDYPRIVATHWWDGVLNITALGYDIWSNEIQSVVNSFYGDRTTGSKINIDAEKYWSGSFRDYSKYCFDNYPEES